MGNVLRRDDGFGVAVADLLAASKPPPEVTVMDFGIGGIHLVQEMMNEIDALIVVDAVDLGRNPGTVLVVEPVVEDIAALPLFARHDRLADMHYATPERALMLAGAVGCLPATIWVVGCQPLDADGLGEGLSDPVASAIPLAVSEVRRLIEDLGVTWGGDDG